MTLCKNAAGIKSVFTLFLFSVSYPTKLQFKIYSFCNRKSSVMRAYTSPFINEDSVSILLIIVALYLIFGLLISFFFLVRGLSEIDEGTHGTGISFRLIILPGMIVFWPVLLKKWLQVRKEKVMSQAEE